MWTSIRLSRLGPDRASETEWKNREPYRECEIATARQVSSSDGTMRRQVRAESLEQVVPESCATFSRRPSTFFRASKRSSGTI